MRAVFLQRRRCIPVWVEVAWDEEGRVRLGAWEAPCMREGGSSETGPPPVQHKHLDKHGFRSLQCVNSPEASMCNTQAPVANIKPQ